MRVRFCVHSETEETQRTGAISHRDREALSSAMLAGAREIMGHDIRDGHLGLTMRIDAKDDGGTVVETLHFRDAVSISHGQASA